MTRNQKRVLSLLDTGKSFYERLKMKWWEYFGSLFLAPYLWFKGRDLKHKTESAINTAGYIGIAVICVFILVVIAKWSK